MIRVSVLPTHPGARFLGIAVALLVVAAGTLARPGAASASGVVASDTFTRTVATGWGTLDTGQSWYITNANEASTDVNGSVGQMIHSTIGELKARVPGMSLADVDISARFRAEVATDDAPTSATEFILYTRYEPEPAFRYYLRVVLSFVHGAAAPVLRVDRQAITYTQGIATAALPATANDPTQPWMVRFQTVGTAIRGKAWPASSPEPSSWQIDFTDDQVTLPNQFAIGTFADDVTPAMPIDVDNVTVTDLSTAATPPFTDISDSTFYDDIVWLWNAGITKGCTATTFCPDDPVTRGQMAAFLVRALALPPSATNYFTDDDGTTFENDINALAASGITKGCTATTFCPDDPVTRGQMAAFLVRALALPPSATNYFTDDDGTTFENDINALAASGITKGCSPTTFCPTDSVTRGQMAAFLHRALG